MSAPQDSGCDTVGEILGVWPRRGPLEKFKEIFPDEQGNATWDQENFDEDTTQQMLDWYYSKSRAV